MEGLEKAVAKMSTHNELLLKRYKSPDAVKCINDTKPRHSGHNYAFIFTSLSQYIYNVPQRYVALTARVHWAPAALLISFFFRIWILYVCVRGACSSCIFHSKICQPGLNEHESTLTCWLFLVAAIFRKISLHFNARCALLFLFRCFSGHNRERFFFSIRR